MTEIYDKQMWKSMGSYAFTDQSRKRIARRGMKLWLKFP